MGLAYLICIVFLMGFVLLTRYLDMGSSDANLKRQQAGISEDSWEVRFWIVSGGFLVLRLLLALFTKGYPSDMNCWSAWGQRMAQVGAAAFYEEGYFCDYPPGYLYVLSLVSRITGMLHVGETGTSFFFKLPAVICDMILARVLYITAHRTLNGKTALLLSALFLAVPIFILDSAVWGQIESVLMVLLIVSMLKLHEKRFVSAVLLYVLAVLIKPQGLIAAPVYLFALLDSRNWKSLALSVAAGIGLFLLGVMPFSPAWQADYTGFSLVLHALNPLWVIQKYLDTLGSYAYFSVNAYNFYTLLGLNWKELAIPGMEFAISIANGVILALSVLGCLFLFMRLRTNSSKLFISAYFLFGFLFTFAFKMHERYIVLPVLFLLLEFLFSKNRRILYLFIGFSTVGFLNLYHVLQLVHTTGGAPAYSVAAPIALAEVLLFIASLWVILQDYVFASKTPEDHQIAWACRTSWAARLESSRHFGRWAALIAGNASPSLPKQRQEQMVRMDYLLLGGIVLIYSIIAYANLGDTGAPQTYYKPDSPEDSFIITFKDEQLLSQIDYYCGIGDVSVNPGLDLFYSQDGETWTALNASCKLNAVFKWESETFEPVRARYICGRAQSQDYMLFEAGFRSTEGTLIPLASIQGTGTSDYRAMMDEQQFVTDKSSYANGTYFDEIYHPRTAYEHLHLMPYYETTHPPLGKLIMSLGIALFGMTPFGWRCMGTLMGILMLPAFYILLKKLFGRTRYAVLGTLLFAFDFMHFSLTRIGTIDSYPVFFIIVMYGLMFRFGQLSIRWAREGAASLFSGKHRRKLWRLLALCGITMGLGCASKWTAVYASAGLGVEFFVILFQIWRTLPGAERKKFWVFAVQTCALCIPCFVVVPGLIYTLSYLPISMVDGYGNMWQAMWDNQQYMLSYHSELGGTHPYSSKWYTWPFVYKPMWAYQAPETTVGADQIGCISIFQNPLLSWAGIAAFFYSIAVGIQKRDRTVLFLLIGLLFQYLPWIFVKRYALQYHFFASLPFVILFLVYAFQDLERRIPRFGWFTAGFTALCLIMFAGFYPVISGIAVSRFYVENYLVWFRSWVFFI